jgi:hypothetical protein
MGSTSGRLGLHRLPVLARSQDLWGKTVAAVVPNRLNTYPYSTVSTPASNWQTYKVRAPCFFFTARYPSVFSKREWSGQDTMTF